MSDDLYDAFGGADDLYPGDDEEENADDDSTAGEGSNRLFTIIAIALGGTMVCAVAIFSIWMFVIYPRMQSNIGASQLTAEVIATETPTEEPTATATQTPTPTATVRPSLTPTQTPVIHTPMPDSGTVEGGGGGENGEEANINGEVQETPHTLRRTPTPGAVAQAQTTPTLRVTRTAASGGGQTPQSGLGEVVLVVGAALLLGVLFTARKLRKA